MVQECVRRVHAEESCRYVSWYVFVNSEKDNMAHIQKWPYGA
jgi:hypothetical protein